MAENQEMFIVCASIREVTSTAIDLYFTKFLGQKKQKIAHRYSTELETAKQSRRTSKHLIEFKQGPKMCGMRVLKD